MPSPAEEFERGMIWEQVRLVPGMMELIEKGAIEIAGRLDDGTPTHFRVTEKGKKIAEMMKR